MYLSTKFLQVELIKDLHIFQVEKCINVSLECLRLQLTENLTQTGLDFEGHLLPHITENSRD